MKREMTLCFWLLQKMPEDKFFKNSKVMKLDFVVAGYIFHKDKVLLIHHRKLDLWLPVGGHIMQDETPDDALIREIKEEIGIEAEILKNNDFSKNGNVKKNLTIPFNVNVHSVGDHEHCCFFYVCRAINPEKIKTNDEVKNFAWFSKDELNQNHIPSDVREMGLKGFKLIGSD